ncbi:helix-turn-helix domain-containing protein [Streptosporangium algeriense]|uniref:Helix-turn-helix domain-containing protein n=1 Tax=Streptosporangium algeriense TaxID=1682748 RepID=A0ABW3DMH2_9ACTN
MSRPPKPVDPAASPWHLLGATIQQWREAAGMAQRELGERVHVDNTMISAWEHAAARPDVSVIEVIDRVLGAKGSLVALHAVVAELDRLRTLAEKGKLAEGDGVDRRKLLQLAAGTALGTLGVAGEPVRRLLDLSMGESGFRSLEEWDLACADHLHALRTRRSAQVAADVLVDLATLREQMDFSSPTETTALHRTTAALSMIHANALTGLGEHSAAIRWWRTARQAADVSGDLRLRLLSRGEEAGHGLYGQRAPETVLRLTQSAERIAGGPTVDLLVDQGKALSLLGRHAEARAAMEACLRLAEKGVPADDHGFWRENILYFAQSWVHSAMGDDAGADRAQERVLRTTSSYVYRANIVLHRAWSTVVQGGVDEGVRQAATEIDRLPSAYRDTHILETGRMLLRAVPVEHQDRPAVGELRELLTAGTPRSA